MKFTTTIATDGVLNIQMNEFWTPVLAQHLLSFTVFMYFVCDYISKLSFQLSYPTRITLPWGEQDTCKHILLGTCNKIVSWCIVVLMDYSVYAASGMSWLHSLASLFGFTCRHVICIFCHYAQFSVFFFLISASSCSYSTLDLMFWHVLTSFFGLHM